MANGNAYRCGNVHPCGNMYICTAVQLCKGAHLLHLVFEGLLRFCVQRHPRRQHEQTRHARRAQQAAVVERLADLPVPPEGRPGSARRADVGWKRDDGLPGSASQLVTFTRSEQGVCRPTAGLRPGRPDLKSHRPPAVAGGRSGEAPVCIQGRQRSRVSVLGPARPAGAHQPCPLAA